MISFTRRDKACLAFSLAFLNTVVFSFAQSPPPVASPADDFIRRQTEENLE